MKESVIFILMSIFYYSCESLCSESNNNQMIRNDSAKVISIEDSSLNRWSLDSIPLAKIGGDQSFSFKFNVDSSGYFLKTISIYSNEKIIQRIPANKEISGNKFQLIDWNFEGFRDITALCNCGSGGCAYWIWNYSPKTSSFIYNKELSEVLGLEIDTSDQFIVLHYRAGYSEERWDSLKYVNNKLQFVKGLHRERWNDRSGVAWKKNSYSKMIKGEIITNVDSFIAK